MAGGGDLVAGFEVGIGLLAGLDGVEEVAGVELVGLEGVAGFVGVGFGPELVFGFIEGLGAADGVAAEDGGDGVGGVDFGVGDDFVAESGDGHGGVGSLEDEAAHSEAFAAAGGGFAPLDVYDEVAVVEDDILGVGDFAVVFEEVAAAGGVDGFWAGRVGEPVDDVEGMLAEVGHLAAGVVPEPAEVVDGAVGVVGAEWGGAEPEVVVEIGGRGGVGGRAEAGEDVAEVVHLDGDELAEGFLLEEFFGFLEMRAGTLLGADLDDAFVAFGAVDHPAALFDEEGEGFFAVDILAGGTGHHGHEAVPVVGCGDDDGVDGFVVEEAAEVLIAGDGAAD